MAEGKARPVPDAEHLGRRVLAPRSSCCARPGPAPAQEWGHQAGALQEPWQSAGPAGQGQQWEGEPAGPFWREEPPGLTAVGPDQGEHG